jgi:ribosomal protein L11 methyltransferase
MKLWRLSFDIPLQSADLLGQYLEDCALSVSCYEGADEDHWIVEAILKMDDSQIPEIEYYQTLISNAAQELGLESPEIVIEPLPDTDWLEQTWKNFPPRQIGQFYVYGSHTKAIPPANLIGLEINAATAFGSGEHETTTGCLLTLDALKQAGHQFLNPLDMGCGSGILAMGIAKIWQVPVLAVDNDPEAVHVTQENARLNHCDAFIVPFCNEGFDGTGVQSKGPFDLITANILANPLCLMAVDMVENLKTGGRIVLSGLLTRQRDEVIKAYESAGAQFLNEKIIGNWTTLELTKSR